MQVVARKLTRIKMIQLHHTPHHPTMTSQAHPTPLNPPHPHPMALVHLQLTTALMLMLTQTTMLRVGGAANAGHVAEGKAGAGLGVVSLRVGVGVGVGRVGQVQTRKMQARRRVTAPVKIPRLRSCMSALGAWTPTTSTRASTASRDSLTRV